MVDAHEVTFLIADFSGRAVVRLTSAGRVDGARSHGVEQAETLPLAGTVYDRVLRTQEIDVERIGDGARHDRPGHRPRGRDRAARDDAAAATPPRPRSPTSPAPRMPWPTSSSRPGGTPTSSSGDTGARRSRWPRRSSGGCCRRPTPARRDSSPWPAGWSRPPRSGATPSTTPSTGTRCRCRSPTPSATRSRRPCWPPSSSAACATGGGRASTSPGRPRTPTTAWPRTRPRGSSSPASCCGSTCDAGTAGIVNAGHPFPLRLRDGRVEEIELRIEPPFGVVPGKTFDVQSFPLEPGDRIVLLTDGMQERNAVDLDVADGAGRQRGRCTRARWSRNWAPRSSARPAGTCGTTPRWSASTGTAARPAAGTASRAQTPDRPRRPLPAPLGTEPHAGPVPSAHHAHRPGRVALHHRTPGSRSRARGRRSSHRPALAGPCGVAVPGPLGLHGAVLPRPGPPLRRHAARTRRGPLPRRRHGDGGRRTAARAWPPRATGSRSASSSPWSTCT